jgi:hypothetical protein
MKRRDKEGARGLVVGVAILGMVFCQLVGCSSSPRSPVAADASVDRPADTSISADATSASEASKAAEMCTGPATGALIDDMSGSSISLTPPSCGTKGTWYAGTWSQNPASAGFLTIPPGDPSTLWNCGTDCLSLYSPLPAGFPGSAATGDDGGASRPQAMCIAGQTGTSQSDGAMMQLVLAWSGAVPDGGSYWSPDPGTMVPAPALIDASDYAGIQFWLWVSPDTAASVSSSLLVGLADKNQIPGGGVCDVNSIVANACSFAAAAVSSSMAQNHGSGRLFADSGSKLTALSGGWQHVWAPWSSFTTNAYYGGANEAKVDPRVLAWVVSWVEHDSTSGPGVPFDYCIYDLSFLPESDVPALDGGAEDGGEAVTFCTGPATGALIDDMSGSSISLAPPPCGAPGAWTACSMSASSRTSLAGDSRAECDCGSLCQSFYSPLPAGFPGTTAAVDAGSVAAAIDGATPGPLAACVSGQTAETQYYGGGLTLEFAFSGAVPAGGPAWTDSGGSGFTTDPPPALIDASQYSGVQFWLWVSPDTAAAVASSFEVWLVDKNQLRGAGICDPTDTTGVDACAGGAAGVSFSVAAASQGTGPLFGADGSELTTLIGGWQLVRAPWSSFLANAYYSSANESVVDPKTLAFAQFMVMQTRPSGPAIPFDFCIYEFTFFR